MADKSIKNWDRTQKEPLLQRIEEKTHRGTPLKERISQAVWKLRMQGSKLEQASDRMQRHEKELFEKCVAAEISKDSARAAIYANECAEVRKMAKIILLSQLAIEQVALRLETVQEFGDVLSGMAPVSGVVHSLKNQLSGIIPEVSYELGSIGEMINGMVVESGQAEGSSFNVEVADEESRRILGEAGLIAEQRMKEKFPEVPPSYKAALEKEKYRQ